MAYDDQPHEFGVPRVSLDMFNEPRGFTQSGEFPAGIVQYMQRKELNQQLMMQEATDNQVGGALVDTYSGSVGSITRPQDNDLGGYKGVLKRGGGVYNIEWSPYDYSAFEGTIIKKTGVDDVGRATGPAFNPDHADYAKYSGLRRNLAILRNYLFVQYFPDGRVSSNPESADYQQDQANLAKISQIAEHLGNKLASLDAAPPSTAEKWFHSLTEIAHGNDPLPDVSTFMSRANLPDVGTALMYDYLLSEQAKPVHWWKKMPLVSHSLTPADWGLKPREQTVFSDENIKTFSRGSSMEAIASDLDHVATSLHSIDRLSAEDRKISIEHARNILENLKFMVGNPLVEGELRELTDEKKEEALKIQRVALGYRGGLSAIAKADPELLARLLEEENKKDADGNFIHAKRPLMEASDAINALAYHVKEQAAVMLNAEGQTESAQAMREKAAATAQQYRDLDAKNSVRELLDRIGTGLDAAYQIERSLAAGVVPTLSSSAQIVKTNQINQDVIAQQQALARQLREAEVKSRVANPLSDAVNAAIGASSASGNWTISGVQQNNADRVLAMKAEVTAAQEQEAQRRALQETANQAPTDHRSGLRTSVVSRHTVDNSNTDTSLVTR
jgi:hypothetical protein